MLLGSSGWCVKEHSLGTFPTRWWEFAPSITLWGSRAGAAIQSRLQPSSLFFLLHKNPARIAAKGGHITLITFAWKYPLLKQWYLHGSKVVHWEGLLLTSSMANEWFSCSAYYSFTCLPIPPEEGSELGVMCYYEQMSYVLLHSLFLWVSWCNIVKSCDTSVAFVCTLYLEWHWWQSQTSNERITE